jgi:hypothetical protein
LGEKRIEFDIKFDKMDGWMDGYFHLYKIHDWLRNRQKGLANYALNLRSEEDLGNVR